MRALRDAYRMCRAARAAALIAIGGALGVVAWTAGCGSDGGGNGGPAEPTGIAITLGQSRVQVTCEIEAEAVYTYARAEAPECDWYVDGILGGNPQKGTITQENPATYTAPAVVPAGDEVTISAVSRSDSTMTATDTLEVAFTIKYVDADEGSDTAAGGAWAAPFKTVNYAMDKVSPGDTVYVLPGTYDEALGEEDSFYVAEDVTLCGAHRDSVFLVGSTATYLVEVWDGSVIEHLTIDSVGDAWHGIHTDGDGAYIRDVRLDDAYDNSAIRIVGPGNEVVVEDCEVVNDTAPGTERGFEIIQGAHSTVRNTIVRGWGYGIMVTGTSDPVIEGCTITENITGLIAYGGTGEISQPDVGGGARGCLGGNVIQGNSQAGLANRCDTAIWAQNNTWDHDPPTEGPPYPCDIENEGAGSVIWF